MEKRMGNMAKNGGNHWETTGVLDGEK